MAKILFFILLQELCLQHLQHYLVFQLFTALNRCCKHFFPCLQHLATLATPTLYAKWRITFQTYERLFYWVHDELTMPPELHKVYQQNDLAVMKAYGFDRKITESECVAELKTISETHRAKIIPIYFIKKWQKCWINENIVI